MSKDQSQFFDFIITESMQMPFNFKLRLI